MFRKGGIGMRYDPWGDRRDLDAFVGSNAAYYRDRWMTHLQTSRKGWNWAAFFCFYYWMIYRRMYLEAIAVWVTTIVVRIFVGSFSVLISLAGPVALFLFSVIVFLAELAAIGWIGNILYYKKYLRVYDRTYWMQPDERYKVLRQKGGTSMWAVILLFLLEIIAKLIL